MAQKHTDYLALVCQSVSITYIITQSNIKKEEKLILSLVKHSIYTIKVNIAHSIRQLVRKVKKTKLVLKYSFYFGRRSDGIVLIKPTNTISSFSDHLKFNSIIFYNFLKVKSLLLKEEKSKKAKRKTTTKKLFDKAAEKAKMNKDLKKTQTTLQAIQACKNNKCQYYERYC